MTSPPTTASDYPGSTRSRVAEAQAPARPLPAWVLSFILHATVLLVLGYTVRLVPRGVAVEPDRTAGIALVKNQDGQREYYDHVIRGEKEYERLLEYVVGNPLAAGLEDWPWVGYS